MKKRILLLFFLAVLIIQPLNLSFANDKTGTTGAAFLKISPGARPSGLGESFVSVANDAYGLYYNPAGISTMSRPELAATYSIWFADMKYSYLAYCFPANIGVFGLSITYMTSGEIEGYIINSNNEPVVSSSFSANDIAVGVSYGFRVFELLSFGTTVKYITQSIDNKGASGFAVDLGMKFRTIEDKFTFGVNVQNIGTGMKFINESASLPLNIKIGASVKEENVILSSDFNIPSDNNINFGVGLELLMMEESLALRAGYTKRLGVQEYSEGLSGLTAGIGFIVGDIGLDYAFVPYGNLGATHRISIGFKF